MFGKLIPKLIFAGALLASGIAWAADPSVDQIYQAAKAGNYSQAQGMMDQVLRDHPNSAKAHFIQAELYAKEGKLNAARGELQKAQQIDPNMSFANPRAVQELKSQLSSGSGAAPANGRVHVPWGPLLGGLAILVFILMLVRSRSQRAAALSGPAAGWRPAGPGPGGGPVVPGGGGAYGPAGGYGPGGGTMMPPAAGGGMGSGIMGGLATGAAVGAGMVAGEALMHKVMGGGTQQGPVIVDNSNNPAQDAADSNSDMGGNDFGVNDASSWDDGSNSGGTDWGSDSGGGWDDSGGGSDDDWNT